MSTKTTSNKATTGEQVNVSGFYHPGERFEEFGTRKENLYGGGIAVEFKSIHQGVEPATVDYTASEAIRILSKPSKAIDNFNFLRDMNRLRVAHGVHMNDITVSALGAKLGLDVGRAILALPALIASIKETLARLEARSSGGGERRTDGILDYHTEKSLLGEALRALDGHEPDAK